MTKSQLQENICMLYLRLNGYLTNSLIIHSPSDSKSNRTDIDILGVRFPYNKQKDRGFDYDEKLEVNGECIEIIIGEVKGQDEQLKFNKSIREKYTDEVIEKLFNWIGIFDSETLPSVVNDFVELIQTKGRYNLNDRLEKLYSVNGFKVRLRPLIFGIDRFEYKDNQIWHINGKSIIDFLWKCFREDLECRDCQLKYDYKLWGGELEPIIRYFKNAENKPNDFKELYKSTSANLQVTVGHYFDQENDN
ncbi:hypothetical protein ACRTDU_16655 [Sunxiuqinia elliptica]